MASCAASLTASSLSLSSGSGAGARAADSGEATRWAPHLPSSPASTAQLGDAQLEVAGGGRQGPPPVPVPAVDAPGRPGAAGRAAGLLRLRVHQGVDHGLDHLPAELPQVVALREQREQGLGLGPVEGEPPLRLG